VPQLRILCWNIQDLGTDQVDDASFVAMMVDVIHNAGVDVACILETKADEGTRLGGLLKTGLDTATARTWSSHSSPKSGPSSNKPENYIFLWDTAVVTAATGWKFPATPPAAGFTRKHIKDRFPYFGEVTVNGKSITLLALHTTFAGTEIVECNQNLATIPEVATGVGAKANVILMGDFNDKAAGAGRRKHRRGRYSFDDLYAITKTATAAENYVCAHDDLTSLKTKTGAAGWAATTDARASYYDHFFWRSTGGQLSNAVGTTIDLLVDLQVGHYLHARGKAVFNNWAARKNAEAATPAAIKQRKVKKRPVWVDIAPFGPADDVTTVQLAHKVYFDSISDHLPVRLVIDVS
jgi:endonuclease/exonuclease/phosphatase family metal-dependent hydrolase